MGLNATLDFVHGPPSDLGGDRLDILRLELWQEISELFTLTIRFRTVASHLDLRGIVSQLVDVSLYSDDGLSAPHRFSPHCAGWFVDATSCLMSPRGRARTRW